MMIMTNLMEYREEIKSRFNIKPGDTLYNVEMDSRKHLDEITSRGINLDKCVLKDEEIRVGEELMGLQKEIFYASRGTIVKANSSSQVANFLASEGIVLKTNRKGNPVTKAEDLEKIDHPIIPFVISYRKLLSSHSQISSVLYAEGMRAHPNFDSLTCPTGRIYSSGPNIMGWGVETQSSIIPDEGYKIIKADYKAQDLRVLAALSDCRGLKKAFAEKLDPHEWVAALMLNKSIEEVTKEERKLGKELNFGTVYLQTAKGLSIKLGCSEAEAAEFQRKYYEVYPEIPEWTSEVIKETERTGVSRTYFGRERRINMRESYGFLRDKAERQAVNTPTQGTGADLIKTTLAKLPSRSQKLQVLFPWHDALVLQYKEGLEVEKVKAYVESIMVMKVKDVTMEISWE